MRVVLTFLCINVLLSTLAENPLKTLALQKTGCGITGDLKNPVGICRSLKSLVLK